ncbi:Spo0B C-terminal domain-containing protein [Bacillus carboniphilus]|uniref:Spo0B C-terminal domain-containing protein n=1 Tax=Bacillus carboniphilus TaxID=86663 RepID=A0ABY9JXF7_9BACI|nr:Spo0B C-terminal domain-containing protein [Bacillus carboniphilus]WLR44076.1 Spo0B C-terminal domain-containing protein [Bacillus carboniphilus]
MNNKNEEWSVLDILRHSRHDWMNRLQLIKGHIDLGKHDQVKHIIEEIIIEAKQEVMLTELKMNSFSTLLLLYNWSKHETHIEYEIIGNSKNLSKYDKELTIWIEEFLMVLNKYVDSNKTNHLLITVQTEPSEGEVCLFFEFNGIISNTKSLTDFITASKFQNVYIEQLKTTTFFITLTIE